MAKPPFNISQMLGLDLDKHIALDAGAGTGKTTVMAERYVQHLITSEQRATLCLPNGPREPLQGKGSLRAPAKERKNFNEWRGLIPSEVVAITFTKKAAAELKARIRKSVSLLRPLPIIKGETDLVYDSRINSIADVEKLVAALDDAPISTIDAFLSGIVSPHLDLVAIHPSREQIAEERTPLLQQESLHTAWRIRSEYDAREAGITVGQSEFIAARNRLAVLLGGQQKAEIVFKGLLWKSLFVEESRRSLLHRCGEMGLAWDGVSDPPSKALLQMIVEPVQNEAFAFATKLQGHLKEWTQLFLQYDASYLGVAENEQGTELTRFRHLQQLAGEPLPTDATQQIQWVWLVAIAAASWNPLHEKEDVIFFTNSGGLPSGNKPGEWPNGLLAKGKVDKLKDSLKVDKTETSRISSASTYLVDKMRLLLNGQEGRLIRMLGRSSFTLEPYKSIIWMPTDCKYRISPLTLNPPEKAPKGILRISSELQSSVLADLLTVHKGCKAIMTLRKAQEGVHDYDDIQILVGDLLLSRCPEICRFDDYYPPAVVEALDSLGDEPWTDHHIGKAITAAAGNDRCLEDLGHRIKVLQSLRRKYRAFIIDEYQDTNPSHFRLLARLWGPRDRRSDEPSPPLGDWDPTICIVGDMKQSIYRFRQAEVTVMLRAVAEIRRNNQIELSDSKFTPYRKLGYGRDPRPTGGGHSFISALYKGKEHSEPWTHIPAGIEDDESTSILSERELQRQEGHIDLTSNYRTLRNIVYTLNGVFRDVFSKRHHALPGDWHAKSQDLNPARNDDAEGILEWILPLQLEAGTPETDMLKPLIAFNNPKAKSAELEHEMIASRLHALFNNAPTNILDGATNKMVEIKETDDEISPDDVIILLHARTHLPDLIDKLQAKGIPVLADKQGALLARPVCIALMAVLELMSNPHSKHAALAICRSPIMGLTDKQIAKAFSKESKGEWWSLLIKNSPSEAVKVLLEHMSELVVAGAVYDVFDAVLDHSDLLTAYPGDSDRQNGEAWYALANKIGNELGHDCSAIYQRMKQLAELKKKGPKAVSVPSGGAVQIMTIHGVKGLQSKVVVVAGLFNAGKMDATMAVKENVLVTPQVLAGRINPWMSRERPYDGLWQFTKNMDSAQTQAERRREFYVALTRVEDRLILVGSHTNEANYEEKDGYLKLKKSKPNKRSMGLMLLEGLRGLAHSNSVADSPWLLATDIVGTALTPYAESELIIDPLKLYSDSGLGGDAISSIRIYHSPDCFGSVETKSPLSNWLEIETRVDKILQTPPASKTITDLPMVSQSIRMSSHSLDTAHQCRRRHWLEHIKGWKPEKMQLLNEQVDSTLATPDNWPSATKFGLIMHRLVEVGLANPAAATGTPCLDLADGWRLQSEDALADMSVIEQVLTEFNITSSSSDKSIAAQARITAQRLVQLSLLTQNGLLGKLSAGDTQNGFTVEGLRTELPFLYKHNIPMQDKYKTVFSLSGPQPVAEVEQVTISFDGRADLVLALRDKSNKGYLQVVDLKTTGCRDEFDESDASKGHLLQRVEGDPLNPFATTDAEKEILAKYRLQLTLYSLALEAMESAKPAPERREILAPALLIGASGRMVRLTPDDYQKARKELEGHLEWMAQLSVTNTESDEPPRLEKEAIKICKQCPYYNGKIRLCGPIDANTGHINNNR